MSESSSQYQQVAIPKQIIGGSVSLSLVVVAFLFWLIYGRESQTDLDVSGLSVVNACLNATSATCLVAGYLAIKKGQWRAHRNLMLTALFFSSLFLISYIIYHTFHGDSLFLGQGLIRPIYFFILITHIVLSALALPLILVTVSLSLTKRFKPHKAWARWTFPIWTYVSVTGVLIVILLKVYGSA